MESMSDCGSVLSDAELMERAILIVSANRRYFRSLMELQRTLRDKYVEPKRQNLGEHREHFRGWQINTVHSNKT